MSYDLGICERCGEKPAEMILKIGMEVTVPLPDYPAGDKKLSLSCAEIVKQEISDAIERKRQ